MQCDGSNRDKEASFVIEMNWIKVSGCLASISIIRATSHSMHTHAQCFQTVLFKLYSDQLGKCNQTVLRKVKSLTVLICIQEPDQSHATHIQGKSLCQASQIKSTSIINYAGSLFELRYNDSTHVQVWQKELRPLSN